MQQRKSDVVQRGGFHFSVNQGSEMGCKPRNTSNRSNAIWKLLSSNSYKGALVKCTGTAALWNVSLWYLGGREGQVQVRAASMSRCVYFGFWHVSGCEMEECEGPHAFTCCQSAMSGQSSCVAARSEWKETLSPMNNHVSQRIPGLCAFSPLI